MQTKKFTSWKKNRKFGDVIGGRKSPKLADNIFKKQHNFSAPTDGQETPIFKVDNPSRDFYFPVSVDEVKDILDRLPKEHTDRLTHIWFQKIKKSEYLNGKTFQGAFISGSGVFLIILNPFPTDNKMRFGKKKPLKKTLNYYKNFTSDFHEDEYGWYLKWTEEKIKQYYLEDLLLHEIGHSIDSFYKRFWSKAGEQKRENWAENYVAVWANEIRQNLKHDQ